MTILGIVHEHVNRNDLLLDIRDGGRDCVVVDHIKNQWVCAIRRECREGIGVSDPPVAVAGC